MSSGATYRKLYSALWRHQGFRNLTRVQREVTLYVLSGPQANSIGCFYFSLGAAGEDLETDSTSLQADLSTVCATFEWQWLPAERILFVPSWLKWNPPNGDNARKAWRREILALPTSLAEIRQRLLTAIDQRLDALPTSDVASNAAPSAHRDGDAMASERHPDTVATTLERHRDSDQSIDITETDQSTDTRVPRARAGLVVRRNLRVLNEADAVQLPIALVADFTPVLRARLGADADVDTALRAWVHEVSDRTVAAHGGAPREMLEDAFGWWRKRLAEDWGVNGRGTRRPSSDPEPDTLWAKVCGIADVGRRAQFDWLLQCSQVSASAEVLVVQGADLHVTWIRKHYLPAIERALAGLAPGCRLELVSPVTSSSEAMAALGDMAVRAS